MVPMSRLANEVLLSVYPSVVKDLLELLMLIMTLGPAAVLSTLSSSATDHGRTQN